MSTEIVPTHSYFPELQRQFRVIVPKLQVGMNYLEQNKYVSWDFSEVPGMKTLELLHITDVQFGAKRCNIARLIEYRDWVLAKNNRYVLFGGDMVDAATVHSKALPWDNIGDPQTQLYQFCQIVAPMRHRVLGYVGGNHERRSMAEYGDLGVAIASHLQIPYSAGQQFIDIYFGDHRPFKVALWHGGGSAQTKGSIANVIQRFVDRAPDSQLYLIGHLHQCEVLPGWHLVRDTENKTVRLERYIAGMSTSFLEFWGTYAEVANHVPGDVIMLRTVLERNGHWEVTLR